MVPWRGGGNTGMHGAEGCLEGKWCLGEGRGKGPQLYRCHRPPSLSRRLPSDVDIGWKDRKGQGGGGGAAPAHLWGGSWVAVARDPTPSRASCYDVLTRSGPARTQLMRETIERHEALCTQVYETSAPASCWPPPRLRGTDRLDRRR